jgi:hypothetical protein
VTDKEDSESEYCPSEHSLILTEANSDKDEFLNEINGSKRSSGSKQNSKNNSGFEVSVQANESGVFCPDDVDLNIDPSQGPKGGNKKIVASIVGRCNQRLLGIWLQLTATNPRLESSLILNQRIWKEGE